LERGIAARIEVRERRPDDDAAALALRNAVFPPIGPDHWADSQSAAVAFLDGRLVGVIPFIIRPFVIAPGVVIRAAFANSVAVAEDLRDQGIGSRMMAAARRFLPAHADAMCVYTGREADGLQYRFYRRTGHHDLLYPHRMTRPAPAGEHALPSGAMVAASDEMPEREAELREVFADCFAGWGGFPARERGYWRRALASRIFVEVPYDAFDLVLVRDGGGRLTAYAIAGTRERETVVLEGAARDADAAASLLAAVDALATARGAERVAIHGHDLGAPLHDALLRAGFAACPRDDVLSGQVVAPETVYDRSLRAAGDGDRPSVEVWTPERALRLGPGEPDLRLEMKEDELHRLLLRRFDLEVAVRAQRVTVRAGGWDQVRRLARVLAPAPWIYHHMDYI
jgi:GNAT superfamily N-acetyltransferase